MVWSKVGVTFPVLRIARANTKKRAPKVAAADEEITIGVHVECSPHRLIGNINWTHPGDPAVSRSTELSANALGSSAPSLVLEPMAHATSVINSKPLLVPSARVSVGLQACPGLTEIQRAVHVIAKRLQRAEIEKVSRLIGF